MEINEIVEKIKKFNRSRGWDYEKDSEIGDTVKSVVIESAELLQHFQWEASKNQLRKKEVKKSEIADEVADVFIYLARVAYLLDIDLEKAINSKMKKNAKRFPAVDNKE